MNTKKTKVSNNILLTFSEAAVSSPTINHTITVAGAAFDTMLVSHCHVDEEELRPFDLFSEKDVWLFDDSRLHEITNVNEIVECTDSVLVADEYGNVFKCLVTAEMMRHAYKHLAADDYGSKAVCDDKWWPKDYCATLG